LTLYNTLYHFKKLVGFVGKIFSLYDRIPKFIQTALKPIYITHTSAIIPQHQSADRLLQPLIKDSDSHFYVIEPDYTTVIPPMQLRRMSRLLKMGVYSGMDCIRQSGVERPDGIITGTGKGSMIDTEKFVKELKEYNEEALNPTPFILSTYNAINGAIALQTKATGYNQTYVHRGSSFEVSLYDAQLKLNTIVEPQRLLVGCFDEITPEYFFVKNKIGYWKKDRNPDLSLLQQCQSTGTVAGEGTAFFMISNTRDQAICSIHTINTTYKSTSEEIKEIIDQDLQKAEWKNSDIDMLVLGLNGDQNDEQYYQSVIQDFPGVPVMAFKHLCGEYETSGGFALWLTAQLLKGEKLPEDIWYGTQPDPGFAPKKILSYNHYRGLNHNVMLLSGD
jgi:3-oxoacyl-[acyl-carrier-protein] synthase II